MREHHTGFGRAIVVFAGRHIAARAVEVDVRQVERRFALRTRQADELGGDIALAIEALRMRRIVGEAGEGCFAIPEAHELQNRIDGAFVSLLGFRIA